MRLRLGIEVTKDHNERNSYQMLSVVGIPLTNVVH